MKMPKRRYLSVIQSALSSEFSFSLQLMEKEKLYLEKRREALKKS